MLCIVGNHGSVSDRLFQSSGIDYISSGLVLPKCTKWHRIELMKIICWGKSKRVKPPLYSEMKYEGFLHAHCWKSRVSFMIYICPGLVYIELLTMFPDLIIQSKQALYCTTLIPIYQHNSTEKQKQKNISRRQWLVYKTYICDTYRWYLRNAARYLLR